MSSNSKNKRPQASRLYGPAGTGLAGKIRTKQFKKQNMKKGQIKLVLLVILGLGVMATVQAQTAFTYTGTPQSGGGATYNSDLILGFTATTGNDIEFDLGPASSLVSGDSWNLSSIL